MSPDTDLKTEIQIDPQAPALPRNPFLFALHFIKNYWHLLLLMLALETGQAAFQILIPSAVREIIDTGSKLTGTFDEGMLALKPALIYFLLLCLGILIFSRASGSLLVIVGPLLRRKTRSTIYHYLQYHSHRFFIGNFAGSLANRISEISVGVNHSLWSVMFDFWPVLITFTTSLYLMHSTQEGLALFLGGWVLLYIVISFLLATRCQKYAKEAAATRSLVSGKIVDVVTNTMNTKLFARLGFERSYLMDYLDLELKTARRTFWFMEAMRWFQFISTTILQIAIILMALKYWLNHQITVGQFAMVTSLALLVINDARGLSRRFLEFFEYIGNITDGINIIVRPHEIIDRSGAKHFPIYRGEVKFNNVCFSYTEGRPIFSNLNVVIKPGERVGLVGYSGSGKTTFVNLVLRMYELDSGEITIDGHNILDFTQDSLRSQISMIPQDPMLFHRSLKENIRYGRTEASDEEVIAAAQAARADDFIRQLPEGYNSLVGERGVKLSGGQRQRIAIARAVLKDAPLLMLDEATSSLDSITEKLIQSSLEELMKNRTVIVIAHRLSTIAHLNRILVFDRGQIIEDGSHEELLKKNGHYARLWHMQAGGFLPQSEEAVSFSV